jgi:hypothetical protein
MREQGSRQEPAGVPANRLVPGEPAERGRTGLVLIEFAGTRAEQNFHGVFPDRTPAGIICVDPLTVAPHPAARQVDYPARVADYIAGTGVARVRLCAACRGAALPVPLSHRLAAHGIETAGIAIVDPVVITPGMVMHALRDIAHSLGVADPVIEERLEMDYLDAVMLGWISELLRQPDFALVDEEVFRGELFGRYHSWIDYHLWALAAGAPAPAETETTVLTTTDPGQLDPILGHGAARSETRYPPAGDAALAHPDIVQHLRRFAEYPA